MAVFESRRDAGVSDIYEAALRAALRGIVEDLDRARAQLVDLHSTLPVPPEEAAIPADEEEPGLATDVRSVIECVLNDRILPAIRDLAVAANDPPKTKGSE
jgi:hypothetical protein